MLQVGHVERFNPALAWVASDVRDPKYIEATRTSGYTFRSTDIGVVLDMMIHDLDIVLSLANSSVTDVQALGISVLGGHEDMATARLTFRQRLRGPTDGVARESAAAADDEHLYVAWFGVGRFCVARSHAGEAARRRVAAEVSTRSTDGGRASSLERAFVRRAVGADRSTKRRK